MKVINGYLEMTLDEFLSMNGSYERAMLFAPRQITYANECHKREEHPISSMSLNRDPEASDVTLTNGTKVTCWNNNILLTGVPFTLSKECINYERR